MNDASGEVGRHNKPMGHYIYHRAGNYVVTQAFVSVHGL